MLGSIEKRQGPQGVAYRVRVEFPADPLTGKRRQRSKTFRTKREAGVVLAQWTTEVERGTAIEATKLTVGGLLRHWLDTVAQHKVKATTLEDYEGTITKHVLPALGHIPLQRLTAAQVQAFYAEKLAQGASPRTVQLCHLRLSQALKQALRWGMVPRNVCEAVEPPRVTYKPSRTWTVEEARRFLAAAEHDGYHPLWLLALTTGARRGELLGVRWQDLDLAKRALRVRQSVVVLKGAPHVQEPKSAAARRTIKLPPEAVAALQAHRKRQIERRLVAGGLWEDRDFVLATAIGGPINPNNVARNFAALIRRAGVPVIRFHDLRHTHATWLLAHGQPVKVVSERLGHAKTSITLDTYAHVLPDMQDGAVEAIGALLFEESA